MLKELGKGENLIKYVEDRLGHDRRYAIDSTKIRKELGWKPVHTFETGIHQTIKWYLDNQEWLKSVSASCHEKERELAASNKTSSKN
jgi:dTDP-glucose 4,6-dehydratase